MRNGSQRRRNHHKSQKTHSRKGLRPPFGVRGSFLEWFWYQKGAKITKSASKWSQKGAKMTPNCSQRHLKLWQNQNQNQHQNHIRIKIWIWIWTNKLNIGFILRSWFSVASVHFYSELNIATDRVCYSKLNIIWFALHSWFSAGCMHFSVNWTL